MQNQLYAEHEMIFFKEAILGSNLIKKIYLLVHLRSELILPRDIKDIDNDIRNLDSLYEDPFIIAGKIEDLNRKKEFILHRNLLILTACNLKIKKLKNTLRWKIYNFFNFFQDQIIFGDNAIDSIFSFSDPYDDNGSIYSLYTVHNARRVHEKIILGGFMSQHIPIETCSKLDFNDFEGKDHQIIFKGIKELYKLQSFLGLDSIAFELDRQNFLNRVGGKDYLKELINNSYPYTESLVNMHLKFIKSVSRRCELRQEVRDFIINLRENENQVFIRLIEEWLNNNVENIELPIVRNVVF